MNKSLFLANLLMAVAWAAVSGSFTGLNLVFGFVLATLTLYVIREQVAFRRYIARSWRITKLALTFFWELVKSSWRVFIMLINPKLDVQPGIIAMPLTVTKDYEITLLANMITLTPGTLSMDVSEDRKTLYIHCVDVPDPDETIREIKESFERQIMEAFR
ncbi:Na+/H+ antiporter subunit E [Rhodobacteraceae bacterium RKSG542]|uniref:Na+/H+ antiporter subunit E n=1 Tax=Pseudovibrio flavus TaxID=2529854 RepID=UPI0012BB7FB6|nr:Na+/H+ antiporter subunit E [Pseudovibrio flavus]MTI18940.1 Na+/H+ antiporter subunit E [Pseudovibrio flavus]